MAAGDLTVEFDPEDDDDVTTGDVLEALKAIKADTHTLAELARKKALETPRTKTSRRRRTRNPAWKKTTSTKTKIKARSLPTSRQGDIRASLQTAPTSRLCRLWLQSTIPFWGLAQAL